MLNTINKEILVATLLLLFVIGIMLYSFCFEFMVYDFVYIIVFILFYIKYIRLKIKQKQCI